MKSYILLLTFIAIACAVMVHADDDDDDDDDDDNGLSFRPSKFRFLVYRKLTWTITKNWVTTYVA